MSNKSTKIRYCVGGLGFSTKKDLQKHCKGILNDNLGYLEGEDLDVMKDVLKMHPRYMDKTGKGDYIIYVTGCDVNPMNNMFMIEREDGTCEDFSYYKAIGSYSPETRIKDTLRYIVRDQTTQYRKSYISNNKVSGGYVVCEATGLKVRPNELHMDHYPLQFEEIVKLWFEKERLTISTFKIVPPEGFGTYWKIEDQQLEDSFRDFHKENATYRMVLNKVNLQRCKAKVKLPQ